MNEVFTAFFGKTTPRLKRAVIHAEELAIVHKVEYIGTEHILYGIMAENGGMAKEILKENGFDVDIKKLREIIKEKTDACNKK